MQRVLREGFLRSNLFSPSWERSVDEPGKVLLQGKIRGALVPVHDAPVLVDQEPGWDVSDVVRFDNRILSPTRRDHAVAEERPVVQKRPVQQGVRLDRYRDEATESGRVVS